jgi:hypothetical protein
MPGREDAGSLPTGSACYTLSQGVNRTSVYRTYLLTCNRQTPSAGSRGSAMPPASKTMTRERSQLHDFPISTLPCRDPAARLTDTARGRVLRNLRLTCRPELSGRGQTIDPKNINPAQIVTGMEIPTNNIVA